MCVLGCRKDPKLSDLPINDQEIYCYDESSHLANDDPILKEVGNFDVLEGPYGTLLGPIYTSYVKFNPENAEQIIYVKRDSGAIPGAEEIWFYDFCSKESRMISDDHLYSLSWGAGDRILYSGTDFQVHMMNSWGEELQQVTSSSEPQSAGQFSPDGNFFYTTGIDGLKIFDKTGNQIKMYEGLRPFIAQDWIDNEHLIVIDYDTQLYQSLKWDNGELITLHSEPQCLMCIQAYNREANSMYIIEQRGEEVYGLYSFDIAKDQRTFLKALHISYMLSTGDYSHESKKMIFNLNEVWWKDSVANEVYIRRSMLMMNENATNPRIVDLPH